MTKDLASLLSAFDRFSLRPNLVTLRAVSELPVSDGWITDKELTFPAEGACASLLERLMEAGFGPTRRAAAAAMLLRIGWGAGPEVAAYLMSGRVLVYDRFALRFSASMFLSDVAIIAPDLANAGSSIAALGRSLSATAAPCVEALHAWSGFSKRALWSMITSSWAAQVTGISEALGDPNGGIKAARTMLKGAGLPSGVQPELYMVEAEGQQRICQRRALCCLYYKAPAGEFCASCPILPADNRLARNRDWVAMRL